MDLRLSGRRAFISGSTRGIGHAAARALAAEGADVVLHGRTSAGVHDAVSRLREEGHGVEVSGVAGDVGDDAQVARLLDEVGDVDVLVNNVGVFEVAPFTEVSDEDWRRVLDVNLMSAVRLSRQLLPAMLERGWGRGGPTYSDGVASAVRHVAEVHGLPEADMKAAIAARNTSSLVQRFLEPGELASLVAYLASPLSSATNGAALRADGGRLVQVL
jgi:NAD(P)-dependent dehydrogenase (short-subunit alcohol dehydrogenase family)